MHTVLMITVVINLLTGLRIATVHRPALLSWSAFLPQGSLHSLHLTVALILLTIVISYGFYHLFSQHFIENKRNSGSQSKSHSKSRYHQLIIYLGYSGLSLLLFTGACLYFDFLPANLILETHYIIALIILAYIPLHAGVYFVQYGSKLLTNIFVFTKKNGKANIIFASSSIVIAISLVSVFSVNPPVPLIIHQIELSIKMQIDGFADEEIWASIKPQRVNTFGGANFGNGSTQVQIKAVQNGIEAFFNISWQDTSQSLHHLPLLKTVNGWQVMEDGFYHYDEKTYYEDKLAVILSNNCDLGAAGTAHLGAKPLPDKPANWHGKGYHYTTDDSIVDLWQWKAVRTNNMLLMDDNYISKPSKVLAGKRRYTAGYKTDAKRSGAYVMNWQWYTANGITPKRLPKYMPKDSEDIQAYQITPNSHQAGKNKSWVIPWYDAKPYTAELDTLAVGTVLPSVLYRSNRLEGDRADVRAFARWQNGQWSMELSRKLITGSKYDIELKEGICLWLAAFDHSQTAHTRHVRPLQLQFKQETAQFEQESDNDL